MNDLNQDQYAEETKARWGDTQAYEESSRRSKKYTAEDWTQIKGQIDAIEAGMAGAMVSGAAADSARAADLAEQARLHIDRWFYPCSHAMHVGLADMYTADERFKAHYEDRAEGLADFVAVAIRANAARQAE